MSKRIDAQLAEVLVEWDNYCRALGRRFAEGVYGPDDLAVEAQVVLWQLMLEVDDPESESFRKQAKTRISRRLIDLVRKERAAKRDSKVTVSLHVDDRHGQVGAFGRECRGDDVLIGSLIFPSFAEEEIELEEGLARLDAMLSDDERQLLELIVYGSKKLNKILGGYQRRPRSHWTGGAGRRAFSQALKWSEKKTRRVMGVVCEKASIAFAA